MKEIDWINRVIFLRPQQCHQNKYNETKPKLYDHWRTISYIFFHFSTHIYFISVRKFHNHENLRYFSLIIKHHPTNKKKRDPHRVHRTLLHISWFLLYTIHRTILYVQFLLNSPPWTSLLVLTFAIFMATSGRMKMETRFEGKKKNIKLYEMMVCSSRLLSVYLAVCMILVRKLSFGNVDRR